MSLLRAVVDFNRDHLTELNGIIDPSNCLCCIFLFLKFDICNRIARRLISESRIDLRSFKLDAVNRTEPSKDVHNLVLLNSIRQILHEEVGLAKWKFRGGLLELATNLLMVRKYHHLRVTFGRWFVAQLQSVNIN
jgi:hypothetical protein